MLGIVERNWGVLCEVTVYGFRPEVVRRNLRCYFKNVFSRNWHCFSNLATRMLPRPCSFLHFRHNLDDLGRLPSPVQKSFIYDVLNMCLSFSNIFLLCYTPLQAHSERWSHMDVRRNELMLQEGFRARKERRAMKVTPTCRVERVSTSAYHFWKLYKILGAGEVDVRCTTEKEVESMRQQSERTARGQ